MKERGKHWNGCPVINQRRAGRQQEEKEQLESHLNNNRSSNSPSPWGAEGEWKALWTCWFKAINSFSPSSSQTQSFSHPAEQGCESRVDQQRVFWRMFSPKSQGSLLGEDLILICPSELTSQPWFLNYKCFLTQKPQCILAYYSTTNKLKEIATCLADISQASDWWIQWINCFHEFFTQI